MNERKGFAVTSLVLGIVSFLGSCCYGGLLGVIGLVFGVLSIAQGQKKTMAIWGIVLSSLSIVITLFVVIIGFSAYNPIKSENEKQITTESTTEATTTQEETTEQETTEEPKAIDAEELKSNASEVTYEDIYRNPETWKEKEIKITVYVDKYESKFFGTVGTYYCNVNGQQLLLVDVRSNEEPTIAAGDTVTVYGLGGGLATLTESQKNIIGITTDKQESKIPQINMYAAELQ